jgi:hypothetical protein
VGGQQQVTGLLSVSSSLAVVLLLAPKPALMVTKAQPSCKLLQTNLGHSSQRQPQQQTQGPGKRVAAAATVTVTVPGLQLLDRGTQQVFVTQETLQQQQQQQQQASGLLVSPSRQKTGAMQASQSGCHLAATAAALAKDQQTSWQQRQQWQQPPRMLTVLLAAVLPLVQAPAVARRLALAAAVRPQRRQQWRLHCSQGSSPALNTAVAGQ